MTYKILLLLFEKIEEQAKKHLSEQEKISQEVGENKNWFIRKKPVRVAFSIFSKA